MSPYGCLDDGCLWPHWSGLWVHTTRAVKPRGWNVVLTLADQRFRSAEVGRLVALHCTITGYLLTTLVNPTTMPKSQSNLVWEGKRDSFQLPGAAWERHYFLMHLRLQDSSAIHWHLVLQP